MGTEMKVSAGNLTGKMHLTEKGHSGHEVPIDYFPPMGEDNGFTSLELLLISLAGCSGHTVQFVLGRMGKTLEKLDVQVVANRRTGVHPTIITEAELQFTLKGDGLDAASVEKAIAMAEETYCPVWAMLKGNLSVSWKYSLE